MTLWFLTSDISNLSLQKAKESHWRASLSRGSPKDDTKLSGLWPASGTHELGNHQDASCHSSEQLSMEV
eukprot:scaffold1525_cov142-Cylindrotheca_fusiformis.AAC.65